jgi:hypothetical protein
MAKDEQQGELELQGMVAAIVQNMTIPKLYMQSFGSFVSPVDISLVVLNGGVPTGMVSLNYSVAKSLAGALANAVTQYEETMGVTVTSAETAQQSMQSRQSKSS